jgi:hypothetical protein
MALPNTTTDTVDAQANQRVRQAAAAKTTREPAMPIMNAFHPDYMKTFHPDFMKDFRTIAANQEERRIKEPRKVIRAPRAVERAAKPKSRHAMTMAEVTAELLETTKFHVYSKAGSK